MPASSRSLEKLLFVNEDWRSRYAIDEIEVYCDLLEHLQNKIDSLETGDKNQKSALINVQAVTSSYAFELAMKSLWALDNPDKPVPHTHDLVEIFAGLKEETVKALEGYELSLKVLKRTPEPFSSNRYSMESGRVESPKTVYKTPFLRALAQLLRDKLEDSRATLLKSPKTFES